MARIECPRCGKVNDGTTDFCIYCGTIFEEYNPEDDDFNIFTISQKTYNKGTNLGSMSETSSSGRGNYRLMIIIGYIFAILGSVLGFIFSIYLLTRKDANAKKHGLIQLLVLIIEFTFIGYLILSGQMDPNIILNPFNTTNMTNMSQIYNSSAMNMTGSSNLSSLFGF
ncbi:hypothetical protein [Methanobrevibacter sp.]|uniref:hypothetical protein n=1 Tax=Methanobrevibacter sp. TaxID=66852 RepID=UPI00388F43DC